MTLVSKLLTCYEESDSIQSFIDDMEFISILKTFLIKQTEENRDSFYPSALEGFRRLSENETLEILLTLSIGNQIFVKEYSWQCSECKKQLFTTDLTQVLNCPNADCDYQRPAHGKTFYENICRMVSYQFRISESVKPLIMVEIEKMQNRRNKKKGVDKHGK